MGLFLHGTFPLASDTEAMLKNTYICSKHMQEYGYKWFNTNKEKFIFRKRRIGKATRKCSIHNFIQDLQPLHTTSILADRTITRDQSEALLHFKNILVPIGTPVCRSHREIEDTVTQLKEERALEKKENEEDLFGHDLRRTVSQRAKTRYFQYYGCSQGGTCSGQHPHGQHPDEDEPLIVTPHCTIEEKSQAEQKIREMRKLILELGKIAGIPRIHFSSFEKQQAELAAYTVYEKTLAARKITEAIFLCFNPDCPADFADKVLKKSSERFWKARLQPTMNDIMSQVAEGFVQASSSMERMILLSLVAPVFSYAQLESQIPGLTHYSYKRARFWTKRYGPGAMLPEKTSEERHITKGWTQPQVESFINYITSPFTVTELPFGTLTLKTKQGKVTIPATVRNMRATRIVDQYLKYLKQTSQEHLKMSRTSLIKLLKVCTARQSKALAGLDYYTTDASEAFDNLIEIVGKIKNQNPKVDAAWEHDAKLVIRESKQYHKTNYKLHLKRNSKEKCTEHIHDENNLLCDSCERLKDVLAEVKDVHLDTTYSTETEKNYDIWRVNQAIEAIERYKAHIMRGVWNEMAKQEVLHNLMSHEVFITIDWAMKFLPRRAREGQSGWFGKRGLSWHIAVAVIRDASGKNFLKRTYVHVLPQANQVTGEVTAILGHILDNIKDEQNHITQAVIRSDNAAHYKASNGIATIPELSKGQITIRRWMFSEPQTGKGPADRAAARIKRQVYMYVDEKKDVVTAEDFVQAASSYDGLKDVSLFVGTITVPGQSSAHEGGQKARKPKSPTIPGISKLYDFQFRWTGFDPKNNVYLGLLRAWRMPNIGDGIIIDQKHWLGHGNKEKFTPTMERHENSEFKIRGQDLWKLIGQSSYPSYDIYKAASETDNGVVDSDESDEPESAATSDEQPDIEDANDDMLFDCPETNCIRKYQYYGNLVRHVASGNHRYKPERETMQDVAQSMFQKKLETIYTAQDAVHSSIQREMDEGQARTSQCAASRDPLEMGWALRESTPNVRFNQNQLAWLDTKFEEGKNTGMKYQAGQLSKNMPFVMKTGFWGAEPRFQPHEYLKESQIMSYFSRKARTQDLTPPKKRQRTDVVNEEADEQLEAEQPEDSEHFSYVRRDNYVTDPNFDTIEDEIYNQHNG